MYSYIWRHLPGPVVARLTQALLLFAGVVALLFFVIFPRVEPLLPYSNVTIDPAPAAAPART